MKNATTVLLIALMLPSIARAQASKDHERVRVVVAISSGPLHQAAIREAERLAKMRDTSSTRQSQPTTRAGHPVLLGAVIGAGAGYAINASFCRTGESVCSVPGNLLMAGIGAVIGAAIGALVSR